MFVGLFSGPPQPLFVIICFVLRTAPRFTFNYLFSGFVFRTAPDLLVHICFRFCFFRTAPDLLVNICFSVLLFRTERYGSWICGRLGGINPYTHTAPIHTHTVNAQGSHATSTRTQNPPDTQRMQTHNRPCCPPHKQLASVAANQSHSKQVQPGTRPVNEPLNATSH